METSRKYNIDNIRAILIFLVVFGHLLETVELPLKSFIYSGIYVFHMPAFAFVSGMCHKKTTGEKLLLKYLFPYLLFQVIYVLFENKIMHNSFEMQFSMPFWILWYLVALICWNVFAEALRFKSLKRMGVVLALLTITSLLAGFDDTIGFYLSISRTIVFFPFYYAGFYYGQAENKIAVGTETEMMKKYLSLFLVACSIVVVFAKRNIIEIIWLQSTTSYSIGNYSVWIRGLIFVGAIVWIFFLLEWIKDKKYPVLTQVGQNTYLIFVLHGFCVKGLSLVKWNRYIRMPLLLCLGIAFVIVLGLNYLSIGIKKIYKQHSGVK